MTDLARWERVQEIFHAVAALPAGERESALRRLAGDDATLEHEVRQLLADDASDSLLDCGVAALAGELLVPPALRDAAFGPYRIRRIVGEGGMGVVYLAERADVGGIGALKVLRDAWLSPARRERFAAEQRTLARLSHPGIARLFDAGTLADGTPWLVMEYVEGVPLTEHCRRARCSIPERLRLFRATCEAVQHAHSHATIHRDLKPSNILVAADGAVKLLDFGIAKQLEADAGDEPTRTGLRMMTPAYAAPEQIRGDAVGVHSDVYSLGIILYELLAGRLPFDLAGRTASDVERIVAESDPVRPSAVARAAARADAPRSAAPGASAWADLDVLCLTAMHKDPARRYRTVDALIRDLDRYLAGQPLEARPDTMGYRLGKFLRRNRRMAVAAAVTLMLGVGLTAFYTVRLAHARDAALTEAARVERIQRFMLDLFQGGDDDVGPADSLRVVELLDRGAETARALDGDPVTQAELRLTLGGLFQKLGNFPRADTLIRLALDQRTARLGADHPDVAGAMIALGLLRLEEAQLPAAESLVRGGLARLERHHAADHPARVDAAAALGRVLQERGDYAGAIPLQRDVVARHEAADSASAELAVSLSELAASHFYAGDLAAADSLNARVLELSRRVHGPRHPLVAEDLVNLGAAQFERGQYARAEEHYRQALAISRPWYGDAHPRTAAHLTLLGRALLYQDRIAEADTLLRQALAVRERAYGPDHPAVASTLNELGNIAVTRERYEEAEQHFLRMIGIYRTAYQDRHYLSGIAYSNLANVHLARGDLPGAEHRFREAVRRFADAQGADHLNTGIGRIKLGRTLLRQGRYRDAIAETTAGYGIVARQASPGVSFLQAARSDLAAAHDSLGDGVAAERFRREHAANAAP